MKRRKRTPSLKPLPGAQGSARGIISGEIMLLEHLIETSKEDLLRVETRLIKIVDALRGIREKMN